jgi:hypothetical protein
MLLADPSLQPCAAEGAEAKAIREAVVGPDGARDARQEEGFSENAERRPKLMMLVSRWVLQLHFASRQRFWSDRYLTLVGRGFFGERGTSTEADDAM